VGIGCDSVTGVNDTPYGNSIFRFQNGQFVQVSVLATEIAVSPEGTPWVVNAFGNIFEWNNTSSVQVSGCATSIGVGPNGAAWVIGCLSPGVTDDAIFQRVNGTFVQEPGSAVQIAVAPN
jgi:hypothetical protein